MIEDLFGRVLPTYQLVDDSETILEKARYFADTFNHTGPIGHESSVWLRTHRVLDICVASLRAVGRSFQYETEVWNNTANVRMDAVVKEGTNIRLAVEDKSPKIFRRHCTEVEINALCGNGDLHMDKEERGFRSIFFKVCRLSAGIIIFACSTFIADDDFHGSRAHPLGCNKLRDTHADYSDRIQG